MKTVKPIATYLLVFVLLSCNRSHTDKETTDILNIFTSYKEAIRQGNGIKALACVDSNTINYFSRMLNEALDASAEDLEEKPFVDKFLIVSLRHHSGKRELSSFDGKTALVWAVDSGMIGVETVRQMSIGKISINGNLAKGQYVHKGIPLPLYYLFIKEGSNWKLDLTSMFNISGKLALQIAKNQNLSEKELIFFILEMLSGNKVNPNTWHNIVNN